MRRRLDPDQMPDNSSRTLRRLSLDDLTKYTAGWKSGSADEIAGRQELARRAGRAPVLISVLSLIVSIAALAVAIIHK